MALTTPFSVEIKERVELYPYSPLGRSRLLQRDLYILHLTQLGRRDILNCTVVGSDINVPVNYSGHTSYVTWLRQSMVSE
jgi:hypothetical protein